MIYLFAAFVLVVVMTWIASRARAKRPPLTAPSVGGPCEYAFRPFGASSPDAGHGLVLHRLSDDQRLSWEEFEEGDEIQIVRLHGERFHEGIQDTSFTPGNRLQLVREPKNPHDANAVGVWNLRRKKMGGYIPKDLAEGVARRLDGGEVPASWSMWEIIDRGKRIDLRILIDWAGIVEPPA